MALSPGEFTTDKYYERFARMSADSNKGGKKPLLMEYMDGTPVGEDVLPDEDSVIQAPPPNPIVASPTSDASPPPLDGCETTCEVACQFPAESIVTPPEAASSSENEPQTPPAPKVDSDLLQKPIASLQAIMQMFSLSEQDILEVNPNYIKAVWHSDGQGSEQVSEAYFSRLQPGWHTQHIKAMKSHVTREIKNS